MLTYFHLTSWTLQNLPQVIKTIKVPSSSLTGQTPSAQQLEPDILTANTGPMTKPVRLKTGLPFIQAVLFYSKTVSYFQGTI